MGEAQYDTVIRGGQVFDGQGSDPVMADIGIKNGLIAAIGPDLPGTGRQEINAVGKIVAPGFVDIHTHYDGQATWDKRLQPSSWHGVTTVVSGNCGVGFAPCKPGDRDRLVRLMEGVEDIPFPVLTAGLPWNWEQFPDYLDALGRNHYDIDIAVQVPHAAMRVYVMGERGANREAANDQDIAAMSAIARQAVEAGALGFSTSRTLNHRSSDGQPTPSLTASEDELLGIARGLAAANDGQGLGVLQFVSDFSPSASDEFAMLRRLVETSGRPLTFTLAQNHRAPESWRTLLGAVEQAVDDGLPFSAQVSTRAVGVLFGLELTLNPFSFYPSYRAIAALSPAERVQRLSDPELKAQLLSETADPRGPFAQANLDNWVGMYPLAAINPDYEPTHEMTIAALAASQSRDPREVALDHLLSNGGRGLLYLPFLSYANGNLDPSYEMLSHRDTVPGLSDGGAHVGMICDGSFPTSLLTHWTRDRTRGPRLKLADAIRMQTRDTARVMGLHDRGVLAPGYRADINVIDYEGLTLHSPTIAYDLPAGGRRLIQKASGYEMTMVAGEITYRNGEATDALPGRLIRGAQQAPMAMAAE